MNTIPRKEHPRPDRMRADFINLNGEWDFEIDNARVGKEKEFFRRESLSQKITVPFCPESKLSGICNTDFMNAVWYRRDIAIPKEWREKRIILHIDACDYFTEVFVNGISVGTHKGGATPFCFDITDVLEDDGNYITVYAEDDVRSMKQVPGKQSRSLNSCGCYYTRTTGIWQTVWLEAVYPAHTVAYRVRSDIETPAVTLDIETSEVSLGAKLTVTASFRGKKVGFAERKVTARSTSVNIPLSEKHLWDIGEGNLYDIEIKLEKDGACDVLSGYFGLREVKLTDKGFTLNGRYVFGRFVLDQGYYPDGIMTAPTDEALIFDIKASMDCGFNGARLHQKVFEPRFLYHADRLGYMVFGEAGNWGLDHTDPLNIYNFLPEWLEEVERDIAHPSVIGWCPFNETWDIDGRPRDVRLVDTVYQVTRTIDTERLIIADSGSLPVTNYEVHDVHDYEQDPEKFAEYYKTEQGIVIDQLSRSAYKPRQKYDPKKLVFVSEWGGIKWVADNAQGGWGYGKDVKSEEEFFERLQGLAKVLYNNKKIFATCYTQLYDIEQEQNGFLTYERKFKFAPEKFKEIIGMPAYIESANED